MILSGLAVAELSSASEISMAYGLLALLSGILSKQCLAVLWPNAYIWLAKRFAWAMDKPESAAPDVVFEHNPQHKHPAVVVWRTSESI